MSSVPLCLEHLRGRAGPTDSADREAWPPELTTCWEGHVDSFGAMRGQEKMTLTLHLLLLPPCPLGDLPRGAVFRLQVLWKVRTKDKTWMDRESFAEDCP